MKRQQQQRLNYVHTSSKVLNADLLLVSNVFFMQSVWNWVLRVHTHGTLSSIWWTQFYYSWYKNLIEELVFYLIHHI